MDNVRVLLAEDQLPLMFEQILNLHNNNGFVFTTVQAGSDAIKAALETRFDVILLDLRMPGGDGLEALRQIRKFDRVTPVIVITAHGTSRIRKAVLEAGANAYFTKPPDYRRLYEAILKLVIEARISRRDEPENEVLMAKQRRLLELQLQAARRGINTPVEIKMEIEDLEVELGEICDGPGQ